MYVDDWVQPDSVQVDTISWKSRLRSRILKDRVAYRRTVFMFILVVYGIEMLVGAGHIQELLAAPWYLWASVGLAVFMATRALAHWGIGDPIRNPFVKPAPDSCGAGVNYEARGGLVRPIGLLFACPFCIGTHIGSALLLCYIFFPGPALFTSIALGLAGVNAFLTYSADTLEWASRAFRVYSGRISPDEGQLAQKIQQDEMEIHYARIHAEAEQIRRARLGTND